MGCLCLPLSASVCLSLSQSVDRRQDGSHTNRPQHHSSLALGVGLGGLAVGVLGLGVGVGGLGRGITEEAVPV